MTGDEAGMEGGKVSECHACGCPHVVTRNVKALRTVAGVIDSDRRNWRGRFVIATQMQCPWCGARAQRQETNREQRP